MRGSPVVTGVEIVRFAAFDPGAVRNIGLEPTIRFPIYDPDAQAPSLGGGRGGQPIVRIHTDRGVTGSYLGGTGPDHSEVGRLAMLLIGRNALDREGFYNLVKLVSRQSVRLGLSVLDCALWDLAGRWFDAPIYELLGAAPRSLPCYASTFAGDRAPDGLSSPKAYADFAEQCLEMGYPGFKVHPWVVASTREVVDVVRAVGERVGGRIDIMLDPFCTLRTFGEAVKVGRACDEHNYFWYEDPFRDGGTSQHAHRKLRQLIRTPLLQLEHVKGLEAHVDFIAAEATDFVRIDPNYDGGVTGCMKIAHAAEGFGLDVELHVGGPIQRQIMTSISNTNYYEMGLVHPKVEFFRQRVYKDYEDGLHAIDKDGCVDVPRGPGIGVEIDWDFIKEHTTDRQVIGEAKE